MTHWPRNRPLTQPPNFRKVGWSPLHQMTEKEHADSQLEKAHKNAQFDRVERIHDLGRKAVVRSKP